MTASIRAGTPVDDAWIISLGTAAYASLGAYHEALTGWLAQPGVQRLVAVTPAAERVGFALVGFAADGEAAVIADLIAIAVEPAARRGGVGRALLHAVLDLVRAARDHGAHVSGIRLTVADDNVAARRLFASAGFTTIDAGYGHYDHGQRALLLGRAP